MTVRVGPKGQVVIPKAVRDRLGLRPGDEVVVDERDGAAVVRPVPAEADLRGLLAGGGRRLRDELEEEHRRELAAEGR